MKKALIISITLFITIIIIKYFYAEYKIEYMLGNHNIITDYKDNRFYIEIDNKYNFDIYMKRSYKKLIINEIKDIIGQDYECVYPIIENIETYPLCSNGEENIDFHLINDEQLDIYKKETINIETNSSTFNFYNNLSNDTYIALWNYKGYIIMNANNYRNVEMFENDRYDNTLSHQIGNKIYMPNYDQEHEFDELIELNIETKEINKITLSNKIDYDSYIVGNIETDLYIFDNKYSVLYKIDLKKSRVEVVGNNEKGFTKYNGEYFVTCSKVEYTVNKITFDIPINSNYEYISQKDGLYKVIKQNENIITKIVDKEVSLNNEYRNNIYYIDDNYLYRYTPEKGNERIFYFFELNFNKEKTIYIYSQ